SAGKLAVTRFREQRARVGKSGRSAGLAVTHLPQIVAAACIAPVARSPEMLCRGCDVGRTTDTILQQRAQEIAAHRVVCRTGLCGVAACGSVVLGDLLAFIMAYRLAPAGFC